MGATVGVPEVGTNLRQVGAFERARVKVNERIAVSDDVGEKSMRDAGSSTACRIAREVAIQVSSIRQVARAAPETLHVDDRDADNRAG